jgi:flagellar hook protein FlgE
MDTGFYTGLSGLKVHSAALNVIGNNLANVNTVGFKAGRASFSEMFSGSGLAGFNGGFGANGAGSPFQVGLGVSMAGVQQLFHQGSLQPTEVVTDLALQGGGFFTLRDPDGLNVFTRAGNFAFDAEGFLVDQSGNIVQGYTELDANGDIIPSGQPSDIQIPVGLVAPPQITSYLAPQLNLNAAATVAGTNTTAEVFSFGVSVFDSLGAEHDVTLVFTPVDTGTDGVLDQWTWEARIPSADLASPTGTNGYDVIDTGVMTFGSDGQLTAPTADVTLSIPAYSNGAAAQDVDWQLFDSGGDPIVTGFSAPSAALGLTQDGYGMGRIRALAIDSDGLVAGVFTNGQTLELAQLTIASFNNPGGLFKFGQNAYSSSIGSGPATLGVANTGGRGQVASRALELSNVDITEEFTDLIVAERGYQSNSRVITTADQVLQEAINIKR